MKAATAGAAAALALLLSLIVWWAPSATQAAGTSAQATIAASLSPESLGGRTAASFRADLIGAEGGIPPPASRIAVMLPNGLLSARLEWPSTSGCSLAHLRLRGARGCGARSQIGRGQALIGWNEGQREVTEHVALSVFIGLTDRDWTIGVVRLEILAEGTAPIRRRFVLPTALVTLGSTDYSGALEATIPPIAMGHGSSDASLLSFSLTLGTGRRPRFSGRGLFGGMGLFVPSSCPAGGFPWAVEVTSQSGSAQQAATALACP